MYSLWDYLSLLLHDPTFLSDLSQSTLHLANHKSPPAAANQIPPNDFDNLPSEIQLMIIKHLPILEIAGTIPQVSKSLRNLVKTHGKQLFRLLELGSRSNPGLKMIEKTQFSSAEELAGGFMRIRGFMRFVEEVRVFDFGSFPTPDSLVHLVNLSSLQMDTYDFIRLEPTPLALLSNLANLQHLQLAGKFVAHHEARKVLANVSKFTCLKSLKTDNFLEPHVDLRPHELAEFFQKLKFLTSLGIIYDSPKSSDSGFWNQLPRVTSLREVAVGISDFSSESALAELVTWLPPSCEVLFLQFGERSNPLKSALHCCQPLILALQSPRGHENRQERAKIQEINEDEEDDDEEEEASGETGIRQGNLLPRLRKLYIDLCGTVGNADLLQRELALKMPRVEVRISPGDELYKRHFLTSKVFQ